MGCKESNKQTNMKFNLISEYSSYIEQTKYTILAILTTHSQIFTPSVTEIKMNQNAHFNLPSLTLVQPVHAFPFT